MDSPVQRALVADGTGRRRWEVGVPFWLQDIYYHPVTPSPGHFIPVLLIPAGREEEYCNIPR